MAESGFDNEDPDLDWREQFEIHTLPEETTLLLGKNIGKWAWNPLKDLYSNVD